MDWKILFLVASYWPLLWMRATLRRSDRLKREHLRVLQQTPFNPTATELETLRAAAEADHSATKDAFAMFIIGMLLIVSQILFIQQL